MSKKKLKAARNGHRAHVKKTIASVLAAMADATPAREVRLKLLAARKTLVEKGALLQSLNDQILEIMSADADIEAEVEECFC